MPTTLSTIRSRVRQDLNDEDAANQRWTDGDLDRHIAQAVRELSIEVPRQRKSTLATTSGSRDVDLSALADRLSVEAVEWPMGTYPATYVRFQVWIDTLTLLTDGAPDGTNAAIYWHQLHTLDASSSTLPAWAEDLVAVGAEAYAGLEWASYAINRANVGEDVAARYRRDAEARLQQFQAALRRLGHRGSLRTSSLYRPAGRRPSQSTDWGP